MLFLRQQDLLSPPAEKRERSALYDDPKWLAETLPSGALSHACHSLKARAQIQHAAEDKEVCPREKNFRGNRGIAPLGKGVNTFKSVRIIEKQDVDFFPWDTDTEPSFPCSAKRFSRASHVARFGIGNGIGIGIARKNPNGVKNQKTPGFQCRGLIIAKEADLS